MKWADVNGIRRYAPDAVHAVFPWMLIGVASFAAGLVAFIFPRAVAKVEKQAVAASAPAVITPTVVKLKLVDQGRGSFRKIDDLMTPFITSAEGGAWAKFSAIDSNGKPADPTTLPIGGMQLVFNGKKRPIATSITRDAIYVQIPRVYEKPPIGASFAVRYPSTIQRLAPDVIGTLHDAAPPDPRTKMAAKWLQTVRGDFVQVAPDTGRVALTGSTGKDGVITVRPVGGLTIRSFDDGTRAIANSVEPDQIPELWRFPYFQARFANAEETITATVTYLIREPVDKVIELPPLPVNMHFGQPCAEPTNGVWFAPSPRIQIRLGNNPRIPKRTPRHVNNTVLIPVLVYGTYSNLKLELEYPDIDQLPYKLQLDGNYTAQTAPRIIGLNTSAPMTDTVIRGLKIHVTGTTYRAIASETKEFKLERDIDTSLPTYGFRRG
jgi:hypothetical protein